jgi:transcriptional regulator with XRE-family HTH domain
MAPRRRSGSQREVLDELGRPIRERIRRRREERGLNAAELARRTGISPAYVTRIEKGDKVPGEEVAVRIAKVLDDDPELYLWWVHGRHMSDPERTLEGYRKSRSASLPDSIELPSSDDTAGTLENGSMPMPVRVYGAGTDPETPEWLWLDPRLLPADVEPTRVAVHRLSEDHAGWLGDLDAGDLVVVVQGYDDPPRADRIYLVMTRVDEQTVNGPDESGSRDGETVASVRLSRVRVTGARQLVLIPGGSARDAPEIIELTKQHGLEHRLVGKVVLVIRRGATA